MSGPVDVLADDRRCHCCGESFARCRETYRGTNAAVDVLKVIERDTGDANQYRYEHPEMYSDGERELARAESNAARAAVAELIEACEARDLAIGRCINIELEYGPLSPQAGTAQREQTDANLRYFAALARVTSDQS